MYQYLKEYTKEIENLLNTKKKVTQEDIQKHLIKISFFQHERQIHLFVTLAYALFLVVSMFFLLIHPVFCIIPCLLICFLIPYVVHYFHLENGVQNLYVLYEKMIEKNK